MSKICQITGKKVMMGNNVSHSKRRTRRTFLPNLFEKRFFVEDTGEWVTLKVSAAGLRTMDKKGVAAAIKEAKEKGFLK
ncbi:50S ribosomal protein L28 [Bacteroidota bacterium]